jgi:hypothetical protein
VSPPLVLAHGLGGRTDLPLPLWLVLYGGAAIVIISFAAVSLLWHQPRWVGGDPGLAVGDPPRPVGRLASVAARALGLGGLLLLVATALFGDREPTVNFAPTFIYITFWVGVTFCCGLLGDVWRGLNPFDTLGRVFDRSSGNPHPRREPPALGYWPAAVCLFGFLWLELVYPNRTDPGVLATAVIVYTGAVVAAAAVWGRGWLRHGEGFTALFTVLGHGGIVGRSPEGGLRLRPPFSGLANLMPERGLEAMILVVLGSTSFDGLTRTQFWVDLSTNYSGVAYTLLGTAGLLWAILVVTIIYASATRAMARMVSDAWTASDLALIFAPSLVPIALAYSVAHYFSLFVLEGQGILALASDPFGFGWDLFGTADWLVNFTLLSSRTVAYIQAGAIIAGHVAAVMVAHDRALALFGPEDATRTQYPLLGAMVTFTAGGLFLLLGG